MKLTRSLLFLTMLLSSWQLSGQLKLENVQDYVVTARFHYGFIVPHHPPVRYLQKGHTPVYELTIGKRLDGAKDWHSGYRFPWLSLGYNYTNFQYKEVLGDAHSLFGVIQIPIIQRKSFLLDYNFSFGFAYFTKVFNTTENYYNIVAGSRVNAYLKLGVGLSHQISPKYKFNYGIALLHYSNGSVKKPNLGINQAVLNMALSFDASRKESMKLPEKTTRLNGGEWLVVIAGGWKEISVSNPKTFSAFSSTINYERRFLKKQLGVGMDFFYDGSLTSVEDKEANFTSDPANNFRQGIHVGYGLVFGNMVFTVNTGYYLFLKHNTDGHVYSRFGLRYYFENNLVANLSLKTHLGVADFVEWGFGYYIR